jgi:hypothetical protein
MEELLTFLNEIKDNGDKEQICKNLLLILKKNYGKLRIFKLTTTNYKFHFGGTVDERDKIFYNEIAQFKDKHPSSVLRSFYNFWSQPTHDLRKMKFELEKTWDTGKRLAYWASHDYNNKY